MAEHADAVRAAEISSLGWSHPEVTAGAASYAGVHQQLCHRELDLHFMSRDREPWLGGASDGTVHGLSELWLEHGQRNGPGMPKVRIAEQAIERASDGTVHGLSELWLEHGQHNGPGMPEVRITEQAIERRHWNPYCGGGTRSRCHGRDTCGRRTHA